MAEKLNCIVVEDELMALRSLVKLCEKNDRVQLVGSAEDGASALELLKNSPIDLIFLDIGLPDMTGLDLLDNLPVTPQVVFTTGNANYAYEAYEYDVTDFLKKPITQERFAKSVEKAIAQQHFLDSISAASASHEIYIKSEGRLIRIPYSDILYFENVGDYVKVLTTDSSYIIHGTMKSIDSRIKHPRFLKVHRSYIVNLDKIVDIEDSTLVIAKAVIPISRSHKPTLLNSINIL